MPLRTLRLVSRKTVAPTVQWFEFESADGSPLEAQEPGAHIELHLPNGLVKAYSLMAGPPLSRNFEIAVLLDAEGKGGSRYMHDTLRPGDTLRYWGPRNNFPLAAALGHSVFVAGGIGITPLFAMLRAVNAQQSSWELHYFARTRKDAPFLDEIMALAATGPLGAVRTYFSREDPAGRICVADLLARIDQEADLYCCGPASMLDEISVAGSGRGKKLHIEHFVAHDAPALDGGFTLRLSRSGKTLPVPAGRSILQVVSEAGVWAPFSCQEGICGVCETAILAGAADHRDAILSQAERKAQKSMMICCSGSLQDLLVLDL